MRGLVASIALGVLVAAFLGLAQGEDPETAARAHFRAGQALFESGKYREAIAQFEAGYGLTRRPLFLLNIGQAYRQLFEPERAREKYRAFLAEAPPQDPARPEVERLIREIDRGLAARAQPTASPSTAPSLAVAGAGPVAQRPSFARRHWWIFPVAGAVVVGAALGIYFGVRPASRLDCGDASIACVDATR